MEPGDKQFRTDAFNAEQSQQANASRERGAAALGQGIGQAGQGIAQGIRWHQEFQASQQAKAFQQSVELERLNMDRMTNQVHMSVMQVQKEEYAAKLQAAQALAQSGIVASQAKMAKLQADMVEFELAQKKKQEEERSQGKFDLSAAVLQAIMRGDTIPSSSPGSYDIPVIDKQTGLAQFRRATPEEVARSESRAKMSSQKEEDDVWNDAMKATAGEFMTIEDREAFANKRVAAYRESLGLKPKPSQSDSGSGSAPRSVSPSPDSPSSQPSKPSRVGMSKDQERYRLDRALSFPAFEMQLGSGQESIPVNFDTLFTRKPNGDLAPNQEAFERLAAPSGKSGGVLQALGGGNNSLSPMVYQERLRSAYYEGKMAIENMQAKGKKVDPNALARIVNAILHGQDPRELLYRAGGK